jgi:hypothetical protein
MADQKINAHFVEPMLLRRAEKLPEGGLWTYELKLDGDAKHPAILRALDAMPDETVIDGEVVAVDESGRAAENQSRRGVLAIGYTLSRGLGHLKDRFEA